MYNALLDVLPTDYKGYLINTDFRIGLQLYQLLQDEEYSEDSRLLCAFDLLYGRGKPNDLKLAYEGLIWFLNGGNTESGKNTVDENENKDKAIDFEYDSYRIKTAIQRTYGIDITHQHIHWFDFIAMISDLCECTLTQIMQYRTVNLSSMSGKEREAYAKMKRKYRIPTVISDEEKQEYIELFGEDYENYLQ